jgi:L-ascorbate metabolism protein UlaG (beta-lactamase superfamily)
MRVTGLGHAGLKVDAKGSTVLIDPWFAPEGAFQASWFQFPDNSALLGDSTSITSIHGSSGAYLLRCRS